jgi:hypothetical protein
MVFLDGTGIRAHQKAASAVKKGATPPSATAGRRWADLAATSCMIGRHEEGRGT